MLKTTVTIQSGWEMPFFYVQRISKNQRWRDTSTAIKRHLEMVLIRIDIECKELGTKKIK